MKINDGFALRNFSDKWIAVSVNDNADKSNIFITLNKSGAFVWELLQNDITYAEILVALTEKYNVDSNTAKADLDLFLAKLKEAGILDE